MRERVHISWGTGQGAEGGSGFKAAYLSRLGRLVASKVPRWLNVSISGYVLNVFAGCVSAGGICLAAEILKVFC